MSEKNYSLKVTYESNSAALQEDIKALEKMVALRDELAKKISTTPDGESAKITQMYTEQVKLTEAINQQSVAIDKKKTLTEEDLKTKLQEQSVINEQKKSLRDIIALENAEAGSLQKLSAENKILTAERAKLNIQTTEGKKRLKEINDTLDKNNKTIKENSDQLTQQRLNVGNYTDSIKQAFSGTTLFGNAFHHIKEELSPAIAAFQAVKSQVTATAVAEEGAAVASGVLGGGLKLLRTALISTGIGALVVALGSLAAYFSSTDSGATKFAGIMKAIGAVVDVVKGLFVSLGEKIFNAFNDPKQALIDFAEFVKQNIINRFTAIPIILKAVGQSLKAIFTLDFDGLKDGFKNLTNGVLQSATGIEGLGDKLGELGHEMANAAKLGYALAVAFDAVGDAVREQSIQVAKNETLIAKSLIAAKNRTKSDSERLGLLKQASQLEEKNLKIEVENAQAKAALIRLENEDLIRQRKLKDKNSSLTDEERQKEVDAINEIEALRKSSIELQEKIQNRQDALRDEITQKNQKALEERQKLEKDLRDARIRNIENDYQREIATAKEANRVAIEAVRGNSETANKLRIELQIELYNELAKIDKKYADARKEEAEKLAKERADAQQKALDKYAKQNAEALEKSNKEIEEGKKPEKDAFDDKLKRQKEFENAAFESNAKITQAISKGFDERSKAQVEAIDKEIAAADKSLALQEDRAAKGLDNTLELEQQKKAKLELEKQKELDKEKKRQKVIAYYNLFSGYAKSDAKTALQKTARDIAISEAVTAAFAEKGGILGDVKDTTMISGNHLSKSHSAGDVLAVLGRNEAVLTGQQVQNMGGADGFYNFTKMLDNNKMKDGIMFEGVPTYTPIPVFGSGTKTLEKKLDLLIETTKNRPVHKSTLANDMNVITEIIEGNNRHIIKQVTKKPPFRR